MPATPPFQDWLKDAVANLEALREGPRVANGPHGDAFVDGYCMGLKRSDGQGDMVKADDRPGPWLLGYRIGLAGWMVEAPGPGFVEYVRASCTENEKIKILISGGGPSNFWRARN
jgi:hypothetical protein